jgi:hypothetical protein
VQYRDTSCQEARKWSRKIETLLRADARVRVHKPLRNCHVSSDKGKNRDKKLTTTDRVSKSYLLITTLIISGSLAANNPVSKK